MINITNVEIGRAINNPGALIELCLTSGKDLEIRVFLDSTSAIKLAQGLDKSLDRMCQSCGENKAEIRLCSDC